MPNPHKAPSPPWLRPLSGWMVVFWTANLPPFVWAYVAMPTETFTSFSLLYLGLVSIIALIAGFGSWWQSLRIEEVQAADADVQEAVDLIEEVKETVEDGPTAATDRPPQTR